MLRVYECMMQALAKIRLDLGEKVRRPVLVDPMERSARAGLRSLALGSHDGWV